MRLTSDDFEHEGTIPRLFTCDDRDISPHLAWDGVPDGTRSLALIVDDPDAPMGTWVHWLVCNIKPDITRIPQGTVPRGALQLANDFGGREYGGPCPPRGTHRYFFKLYALDVDDIKPRDKGDLYRMVEEHKLAEAVLMGRYVRK